MSYDVNPGETQVFEFRGNAREWFGIWIVNLLLSIVTIGVYAAWAKVRRKKYFYNNTYVADRNFDYHATGKQIFIGRVIFIIGYMIFSIAANLNPILAVILILVLLVLIPWLIVKSMQFNARVSSFSNVRFNFVGKTGRAFVVFVLLPLLAYLAIGGLIGGAIYLAFETGQMILPAVLGLASVAIMFLAFPVVDRAVKTYVIGNARLGTAAFELTIELTPFVKAMAAAMAWLVVVGGGFAIAFGATIIDIIETLETGSGEPGADVVALVGVVYVAFFVALLPASFIYQAIVRNAVFSKASLEGGHQFRSTINPLKLFWIALSNAVVAVCTLGLMLPWTHVRMHKYMAAQTFFIPGSSLDAFINDQEAQGMSVADAYTDMEGVDFGIPL
ncbi:MAG: YjgN family protein [Pseudomonadota bacterium]